MLLIPCDRKIDWKRPPLVTIALLLANLFIYFVFQIHDDQRETAAAEFYVNSHLPAIEAPIYLDYLEKARRQVDIDALNDLIHATQGKHPDLYQMMDMDPPFMKALYANELILPSEPQYAQWHQERQQFDALLKKSFTHQYSLRPAYSKLITYFSHMFMHANFEHLLGNMIFLVIVSYSVEAVLGRRKYIAAYLLAGLGSAALYVLIQPDSAMYSLGASGAISGVMGMYCVLFGLRKIRFFYWIVFYFGYAKWPAIILLPIWLGKEAYDLFFGGPSNTNYLAHIGGYLSGAAIAYVLMRYFQGINLDYLNEHDQEAAFKRKYEEGVRCMNALDIPKAERIFRELHQAYPDNRQLLIQRYNIAKLAPASDNYHAMAQEVFNLNDFDGDTIALQHQIYLEYIRIAQPVFRISQNRMLALAHRFSTGGYIDDAETIVQVLLKTPSAPMARVLLTLANVLAQKNETEKSRYYLELLLSRHENSSVAEEARKLLNMMA